MSKQEVKQENKDSEGNPQVKGKIRRLRRDLARRRMMAEVKTATARDRESHALRGRVALRV